MRTTRKGISPVIATVILVAVTITVAISVAYWMGGISGLYTKVEKVETLSVSVWKDQASGNYTITFDLKNTGSADATVNMIYINGKPYDDSSFTDSVYIRESDGAWTSSGTTNILVVAGASKILIVRIQPASGSNTVAPFTLGTTLDVKLHTSSGKDYPQMVALG